MSVFVGPWNEGTGKWEVAIKNRASVHKHVERPTLHIERSPEDESVHSDDELAVLVDNTADSEEAARNKRDNVKYKDDTLGIDPRHALESTIRYSRRYRSAIRGIPDEEAVPFRSEYEKRLPTSEKRPSLKKKTVVN